MPAGAGRGVAVVLNRHAGALNSETRAFIAFGLLLVILSATEIIPARKHDSKNLQPQ